MERVMKLKIPYNEQTAKRLKSKGISQRKLVDLMVEYHFCTAKEVKSMRNRVSMALTGKRDTQAYLLLLDTINRVVDINEERSRETSEDVSSSEEPRLRPNISASI